jgi:thymidylate kinase
MGLLIAVSGAHGTGKSTLCHELVAKLKTRHLSVGLATESARSSHYLLADEKTPEMHLEVFGIHLIREMRALRIYPIVITDRSIFDFIAYALIRFPENNRATLALISFAQQYKGYYNLIFRTTNFYENRDKDKLREKETSSATDVDLALSHLLARLGVSCSPLPKIGAIKFMLKTLTPLIHSAK